MWRLTPKPARTFSGPLAPVDKETVSVATTTLGLALLGFAMTQTETVALGRYRDPHALGVYALGSAIVCVRLYRPELRKSNLWTHHRRPVCAGSSMIFCRGCITLSRNGFLGSRCRLRQ